MLFTWEFRTKRQWKFEHKLYDFMSWTIYQIIIEWKSEITKRNHKTKSSKRNHQNEMQTKSLDKLFLFFFSYFFLVKLVDPVEIYNLNLDYFNFHNVKHLTLWLWRCLCWSKHKRNVRWVSLDFKPIFCYFYFNFHFCLSIISAKHSQRIVIHWWIKKSTANQFYLTDELRKALLR